MNSINQIYDRFEPDRHKLEKTTTRSFDTS